MSGFGNHHFSGPPIMATSASDFAELNELSMLMDSNLNRVPSATKWDASSQVFPRECLSEKERAEEVAGDVSSGNLVAEPSVQGALTPLLATASLSLSLHAAMNSKLLLGKGLVPPVGASSATVNSSTSVSVVSTKKKPVQTHSPLPVMSSFQAQTELDYSEIASQPFKAVPKSISAFPDLLKLPSQGRSFSNPAGCPATRKATIVWFRSDLRIHDNEALVSANNDSLSVFPVYCFDPRDYGKSSSGFDKTGPYRAKFLLECVSDLRENLRKRGSDLIVRIGKPEEVLVKLAKAIGADGLYAHQEVTYEELQSEAKVSAALKEEGIESKFFWGSTLYHLEDLPFSLQSMPSNYGGFREAVKNIKIRSTSETPKQLKSLPIRGDVKAGDIPTLQQLGLSLSPKQDVGNASASALEGGETEALKRLEKFVLEARNQASNVKNGNGNGDSLYGANFSCKISPWLAMGCLSPRKMYEDLSSDHRIKASTANGTQSGNDLNWLVFELLWRDFFRFITKKYGSGRKSVNSPAPAPAMAAV